MPCVGTQQFIVQTNTGFGNTNMPGAIVRALIDQSEPYPNGLFTRKQRASSIGTCTSSSEQGVLGLLAGPVIIRRVSPRIPRPINYGSLEAQRATGHGSNPT